VVRGHAGIPEHVLVVATQGAPERRLLPRRRRQRSATPEPPPEPVATCRVTVVDPNALKTPDEARAWLEAVDGDAEVARGLAVLEKAVQAHRIAAADASLRTPDRRQALVARVGYGLGEQVAQGRWVAAVTVPPPAVERRARSLGHQERFGALLSGRDVALAAETLTLDARRELDGGRVREAALLLRVALEAAIAELVPWEEHGDLGERLPGLREQREAVGGAANAALQGGLSDAQIAAVGEALTRVESALRARAAAVAGLV
jgi:hypothetical protein